MTRTSVVLITNGFDEDDYPAISATPAGKVSQDLGKVCSDSPDPPHGNALSDAQDADPAGKVPPTFADLPQDEAPAEFRVTHTGLFAEDGNPLALWDALAAKCAEDEAFRSALRIRLVGKVDAAIVDAIEARGLGPNLDNLGYRSHDVAVAEQRAASLLILPLRQEPEYRNVLPGKIFEYLAARRPVLGIGQEDGAAAQVLADTRTGVMCDWDQSAAIRSAVDRAWSAHLAASSPAAPPTAATAASSSETTSSASSSAASVNQTATDSCSGSGSAPASPAATAFPAFNPTGIDRYTRRHLTHLLATLLNQLT